jgi:hypothetical protein
MATTKVEGQGGGSHSTQPAGRHLVNCHLSQVGGAPHDPINTRLQWKLGHTPLLGISTCKAPILSVVVRRSTVERVVRL